MAETRIRALHLPKEINHVRDPSCHFRSRRRYSRPRTACMVKLHCCGLFNRDRHHWSDLTFHRGYTMKLNLSLHNMEPALALTAGILILIMPQLLNFIVAIYLIVVGVVGLSSKQ